MNFKLLYEKQRIREIKGLLDDGCNVDEIMAYYGINLSLSYELMRRARRLR